MTRNSRKGSGIKAAVVAIILGLLACAAASFCFATAYVSANGTDNLPVAKATVPEIDEIGTTDISVLSESPIEAFENQRLMVPKEKAGVLDGAEGVVNTFEDKLGNKVFDFSSDAAAREAFIDAASEIGAANVIVDIPMELFDTDDYDNYADNEGFMNLNVAEHGINTSNRVKVAVIDTGIRKTHEMFKNVNITDESGLFYGAYNAGVVAPVSDYVNDAHGHGTQCASCVVAGVPDANLDLVALKVYDDEGNNSLGDFLYAILYAANIGCDVVSLSSGCDIVANNLQAQYQGLVAAYESVIKAVRDQGGCVSVAAGNDSYDLTTNPVIPATCPSAITVGAINYGLEKAYFSNYGPEVDLSAPGVSIYMASNESDTAAKTSNGTSFACPNVSSYLADVYLLHPDWTGDQVLAYAISNAKDLGATGWDSGFGWGMPQFKTEDLTANLGKLVMTEAIAGEGANTDLTFDVTASFTVPADKAAEVSGVGYAITAVNGVTVESGHNTSKSGNTYTFDSITMYNSDKLSFSGLPVGTTFEISQDLTSSTYDNYVPSAAIDAKVDTNIKGARSKVCVASGTLSTGNNSVAWTDTYSPATYGSFSVDKVLVGDVPAIADEFPFELEIVEPASEYAYNDEISYWVQDDDDTVIRSGTAAADGNKFTIAETLNVGDSIEIPTLFANSTVKVTEKLAESDLIDYKSHYVGTGVDVSGDYGETVSGTKTIAAGNNDTSWINTYAAPVFGYLTIANHHRGDFYDGDLSFPFDISISNVRKVWFDRNDIEYTIYDETGDATAQGTLTKSATENGYSTSDIELGDGDTCVLSKIPQNSTWSVTEDCSATVDWAPSYIDTDTTTKTGSKGSTLTATGTVGSLPYTNVWSTFYTHPVNDVVLTKEIINNDGSTDMFPFAVEMTDIDPAWIGEHQVGYTITDKNSMPAGSGVLTASSGKLVNTSTLMLGDGYKVVFRDAPIGAKFSITEKLADAACTDYIGSNGAATGDLGKNLSGDIAVTANENKMIWVNKYVEPIKYGSWFATCAIEGDENDTCVPFAIDVTIPVEIDAEEIVWAVENLDGIDASTGSFTSVPSVPGMFGPMLSDGKYHAYLDLCSGNKVKINTQLPVGSKIEMTALVSQLENASYWTFNGTTTITDGGNTVYGETGVDTMAALIMTEGATNSIAWNAVYDEPDPVDPEDPENPGDNTGDDNPGDGTNPGDNTGDENGTGDENQGDDNPGDNTGDPDDPSNPDDPTEPGDNTDEPGNVDEPNNGDEVDGDTTDKGSAVDDNKDAKGKDANDKDNTPKSVDNNKDAGKSISQMGDIELYTAFGAFIAAVLIMVIVIAFRKRDKR